MFFTNRNNGCCHGEQKVPDIPNEVSATLTHIYPMRKQQDQTIYLRVQKEKRKSSRPPRVGPREVPLVTQE